MAHAKDVQRYKNVTFHSEPVRTRLEKNSILRLNYCNTWGLTGTVHSFSDIRWEYWNISGTHWERRETRLVILKLLLRYVVLHSMKGFGFKKETVRHSEIKKLGRKAEKIKTVFTFAAITVNASAG